MTPRAPRWLSPEGRQFWRLVVPELVRLGVLHPVLDLPLLEVTAQSYGVWRRAAAEQLATDDPAVREQLQQIAHMHAEGWLRCAAEFGLTPRSREQLRRAMDQGQDPSRAFLELLQRKARGA